MKHTNTKTADDVLTTNPAAAFAKFRGVMSKLATMPKSALAAKPKPRPRPIKRKRKTDA